MYNYSINCLPVSLCRLCVKNSIVHQHNTRNSDTLRVSKGTKTFIQISALVWNTLKRKIVCNGSISYFNGILHPEMLEVLFCSISKHLHNLNAVKKQKFKRKFKNFLRGVRDSTERNSLRRKGYCKN